MAKDMESVSVIIPTYNRAHCVSGAIDSVLAQSETDFEIVAIDDGSSDGTLQILLGYAAVDERVRVAHGGFRGARARVQHWKE